MDLKLKGKVALITGAGSGMGQHMAIEFAKEGAKIAVNDVNKDGIAETIKQVQAAGGEAMDAGCDITDFEAAKAMIAKIEATYGRVDIVVNNAAVLAKHALFLETTPQENDKEIKVILYGTMNVTRAVLPGMMERKYGKLVTIATDAARIGQEREVSYSAAKGGVVAFSKSVAREAGPSNINVNIVSPGATNSPMRINNLKAYEEKFGKEKLEEREAKVRRVYPLRRIGEMEDVTNAVLFFASDVSRHMTGQIVSVSGGFTMVG